MRLGYLIEKMRKRQAIERRVARAERSNAAKYHAAAFALLAQKPDVVGVRSVGRHRALDLAHNERNRGKRRAQFVSRRRGQPVERG